MSRAAVRAAITAYFTPASLSLVGAVYAGRPKLIPAQAYNLSQNNGSGAVICVHLPTDVERRVAVGGPTAGEKFNVHDAALEVFFSSVKADAVAAQQDSDTVLDSIVARIRADRTLGAPTVIWQAGEGTTGIRVELAEPDINPQAVTITAVVRFEAWEYVNA